MPSHFSTNERTRVHVCACVQPICRVYDGRVYRRRALFFMLFLFVCVAITLHGPSPHSSVCPVPPRVEGLNHILFTLAQKNPENCGQLLQPRCDLV